MNSTLVKGNGFISLGTAALFIKRKKGRVRGRKKKFLTGLERDGQLQRGAEISFYSQASFFAWVERSNEWYFSPWGHGGITVGTEHLKIRGMYYWPNKCRQMLTDSQCVKETFFFNWLRGICSVWGITLGTDQRVWVRGWGGTGVVQNNQLIVLMPRAKHHNTVLFSVFDEKIIHLTCKSCPIMSILSFPVSWNPRARTRHLRAAKISDDFTLHPKTTQWNGSQYYYLLIWEIKFKSGKVQKTSYKLESKEKEQAFLTQVFFCPFTDDQRGAVRG